MRIERYSQLPPEAKALREEVFVKEQGFTLEFDETDAWAAHFVGFWAEVPAATCRVYRDDALGFVAGRIAVRKEFRGKGLGAEILRAAEEYIRESGGGEAVISAQLRAAPFYEKQGYVREGKEYRDESCPHVRMRKKL